MELRRQGSWAPTSTSAKGSSRAARGAVDSGFASWGGGRGSVLVSCSIFAFPRHDWELMGPEVRTACTRFVGDFSTCVPWKVILYRLVCLWPVVNHKAMTRISNIIIYERSNHMSMWGSILWKACSLYTFPVLWSLFPLWTICACVSVMLSVHTLLCGISLPCA